MSIYAIQQYHKELEKIIHYGGSKKETAIRNAFYYLLNEYAHSKDLMLIAEISTKNKQGKLITPDGTLKDNIRNDWGYWESKDESDDINEEIRKKFDKGYPNDNILFEDSHTAVLYQHGEEVMRRDMQEEEQLHQILTLFLSYERPEVHDFREAIERFKEDIPKVTLAIRNIIEAQQKTNAALKKAQVSFLEMAKASINPEISGDDVKEMMIQHILSADIFNTIFDEPHFHQENNIARELNRVIETFFNGQVRRQTLGQIKHYYDTINARAASIADHHEKQKFLKVVYENFYKGYNPKAADRLGIVYTPNEIVQFMIRSTDYLLHKHFGKTLGDKNVEILDPATGTGTFITDIIDYLPKTKLKHKYKNELHANEVAILPYYIANLNIEYTYKQKMGEYEQFDNLCFVDTLDNTRFHWVGKQGDLFGVSAENAQRIKRQNDRKISVVIGNPPYNALQLSANENNANRKYPNIDDRIKETIIKNSTASNLTKVFDMYIRFYRWAMDRLNDNGVISFVTNRSFIDTKIFDGFRKLIQQDFDFSYIIDTKSDVRANPKIAGSTHNVFGIQTGIAIMFLVKTTSGKLKNNRCNINYVSLNDFWKRDQKLQWLLENAIENLQFENIVPDKSNNWFGVDENDFELLIELISKEGKKTNNAKSLFSLYSLGVNTNRDEWVYDFSNVNLEAKSKFLSETYNTNINEEKINYSIKWSSSLIEHRKAKRVSKFDKENIRTSSFRPFVKKFHYIEKIFNHRLTENHYEIYGRYLNQDNKVIFFKGLGMEHYSFHTLATNCIADIQFNVNAQSLPLYRYTKDGDKIDNITNWALEQFQNNYKESIADSNFPALTKEAIFHYVYGVLHNPAYRKKYELNLKREFPRIPFYDNFWQWSKWGEELMNLHINYETAEPYKLERKELAAKVNPKAKLKALKDIGVIVLDDNTELHGIPKQAWDYKLGNRSALEWILDQCKEKKPSDPTIAEKFNTYKFADYKEQVIDLLKRVCTASVETVRVVGEMEGKSDQTFTK